MRNLTVKELEKALTLCNTPDSEYSQNDEQAWMISTALDGVSPKTPGAFIIEDLSFVYGLAVGLVIADQREKEAMAQIPLDKGAQSAV